jgi:hypothetical protein
MATLKEKSFVVRDNRVSMSNHSQERLEECVDEDLNFTECPECGYDDSDTNQGIAMHYGYNHEGSIGYLFRCEYCEELHFGEGQKNRFCSKECETLDRTGTLKYKDKGFLRKQIEQEGKTVTEIADGLDVDMKIVSKWALEYEIGDEYECPSCDKSFATKQSVSKHHYDKHDESIAGAWYTCKYCGEESWTPKSRDHPKFPKYCDDECFGSDMEGENNPNKDEERKKKIAEGLVTAYQEGRKKPGHRVSIEVEETGNVVDSSWEAEVDKLFHKSNIEYFYNGHGEYKRYGFDGFTHAPDFIVEGETKEIVVEVKGGSAMFFQEDKMRQIGREMTERNDVVYIVYGDVDLQCDYHIEYGNEEELLEIIQSQ